MLIPCALFCFVSRIIWTHQFLYVYESAFETGGKSCAITVQLVVKPRFEPDDTLCYD